MEQIVLVKKSSGRYNVKVLGKCEVEIYHTVLLRALVVGVGSDLHVNQQGSRKMFVKKRALF